MLNVYLVEQNNEWDDIVRSFRNYDVYWLSGYVKAFQIHGDGQPLLFYYDDGLTRGINVVMKRDIADDMNFSGKIPKNRFFDFATPYGYGGWIIEGETVDKLFNTYRTWVENNRVVSEFVRFHPLVKNHECNMTFYDIVELGEVVHIDLSSPDTIWNNFTSKNRNVIRKAIKNDVKIYQGRFPEIYRKFNEIYNKTMEKDEADEYYYFDSEFYTSILEDLPHNAQVFWAEKSGQIVAASIIIAANEHLNYHLSGSLREYNSIAPTNLLLYEAALWGAANNYKTLYLGGGVGSKSDGLFNFKRSFYKGKLNHFYIGKKIFDKESYRFLVSKRESIESSYFPLYRA